MNSLPKKPPTDARFVPRPLESRQVTRDLNSSWRRTSPLPPVVESNPPPGGPMTLEEAFENLHTDTAVPSVPPTEKPTKSENVWTPSRKNTPSANFERKVRALLNKLTPDNFDSISEQMQLWLDTSENLDTSIAGGFVRLMFEKAVDEAQYSSMYAKLALRLCQRFSAAIVDPKLHDGQGRPLRGPPLFRKYLIDHCQTAFETGWSKIQQTQKNNLDDEKAGSHQPNLLSDAYYDAQKLKRQWLGLVKFIGELFKLQLLSEIVVNLCFRRLLYSADRPREENIESACKLALTVGPSLDKPNHSNAMFEQSMQKLASILQNPAISYRAKFMLMDVSEKRAKHWKNDKDLLGPRKTSEFQEEKLRLAELPKGPSHSQPATVHASVSSSHIPNVYPAKWTPNFPGCNRYRSGTL